ncbi:uncharacterized protein [Watersipora subatra]|uniref:uncharacterized protein n=1 Tax=Watersipora subatra TaxID=2589382 RepID=UPI00355C5484
MAMSSAYISGEPAHWTPSEINQLLEQWEANVTEVNNFQNDSALAEIAKHIGSKTPKHVKEKISQMKERYIEERRKSGPSKWRFFNRLHKFGDRFLSPKDYQVIVKDHGIKRRAPFGENNASPSKISSFQTTNQISATANRISELVLESGINKLVQAVSKLNAPRPATELPPVYPFDPEISRNVEIGDSWREWNQSLPYQLTDGGIRTLIRSGFREVGQIGLLKTRSADVAMLHLNYHDKLALQQAMEADLGKTEKFELVTNLEGAVIGIHGSVDASDAVLLTDDGLKMLEWNRTLTFPLSLRGLAKILKAGFSSSEELSSLLDEDDIDLMDLTLRDRIVLRKFIVNSEKGDGAAVPPSE